MKTYEYQIFLSSPLILTTNSCDENTMQTKDFIPGYVLLGSLAGKHKQLSDSEDQFYNFFLSDQVKFCNAFISENGNTAIPSPMAIHKEKAKENYFFFPAMTDNDKKEHPSTKSLPGYISLDGKQLKKHKVEKGIHFHINTEKRDEDGDAGIFHYEFIKKGQIFKGLIKCSEEVSKELETFLQQISTLRLGRSKNTEYGKVSFSFREIKLQNEFKPSDNKITLFFKSPVILRNKDGFYLPSEDLLLEELGFSRDKIEITDKFFRTEAIENFRGIWGMKMPSLTAFKAGCTFTLKFTNGITQTQKERLTEILKDGIGYRKNEGFGEIDFLNLSKADLTLVDKENKTETIAEPLKTPAFMKKVLKKLTAKAIEQTVDNKVINDADDFKKNIPSNSLLSKIDLMVKASDTFENFKTAKIEKLREHAQKQLKKCRNNSITLFDLLTDEKNIQFTFNSEKEYLPQIETKAAEFEYQKRYISGLMRRLRKINKKETKKKDGDNR